MTELSTRIPSGGTLVRQHCGLKSLRRYYPDQVAGSAMQSQPVTSHDSESRPAPRQDANL